MKTARAPRVSPYLTKQQTAVLDLCRKHIKEHGTFPERKYLQSKMGWVKEQSVYECLLGLVGAGYLRMKVKGTKRIFDLTEGGIWDAGIG